MSATTFFTDEQEAAIDVFETGDNLVLSAFAGTGKTTTLRGMAEATPDRKGLYLAYNKAIQTDAAASFPSNVNCRTAHSVAYGWMMQDSDRKRLMAKLGGNSVPSWTAAKILNIPNFGFNGSDGGMRQNACASAVMQTVARFCNSADTLPMKHHVPREFEGSTQDEFATFIAPFANKAWFDLTNLSGTLRFTHDCYLKMWSLSQPKLRYDFILFDEAQDANPCIASVVQAQSCQIVMVGDSNQAIYGWRGAVDAMAKFDAETNLMITQSFRFGDAVAAEANKFLALLGAEGTVKGFDKIASKVHTILNPDAILCRTNAQAIAEAMEAQKRGMKVALVGGTKDIERFVKAADKLMQGKKTEHEELIAFPTWGDAVQHANTSDGKDIKVMVNLIETYGCPAILDVCAASVSEAKADLIVSTAHKAKGREWDTVRIANDFRCPEEGETPRRDELMLMYVAVTRAKLGLDRSGVAWIDMFEGMI